MERKEDTVTSRLTLWVVDALELLRTEETGPELPHLGKGVVASDLNFQPKELLTAWPSGLPCHSLGRPRSSRKTIKMFRNLQWEVIR